ncbi:PaaI family thioesterase [Jatrophihabitans sp.]|uniref:PaaI family thioesterase n=1 Tax=Jatrophihabitans sp. TaxID=1932789 RepID=UPI0030C6B65E|nr:hypothetical protein [Jatrophihabitans sp.]
MTTHSTSPWADEETKLADWTQAVSEVRGGDEYIELIRLQRLVQDRVAGATYPGEALHTVTEKLRELADYLEPLQATEPERWDGWRTDIPGRALPIMPPYVIDEVAEDGKSLRGRVTFTRFYLGGNAAVHGGTHTLLFDDVMGHVTGRQRDGISRTAFLKVNFRRITPMDVELTFDATLDGVDGRKKWLTGRLYNPAGEVCSDAEALFLRLLPGQQ